MHARAQALRLGVRRSPLLGCLLRAAPALLGTLLTCALLAARGPGLGPAWVALAGEPEVWRAALVALGETLVLIAPALLLAGLLGLPLGLLAGMGPGTGVQALLLALPGFWLAVLLAMIGPWLDFVALALPGLALVAQATRTAVRPVLGMDHVGQARAEGVGRLALAFTEVMPAAAAGFLGQLRPLPGLLLSGAVAVEVAVARPGLGRFAWQAWQGQEAAALLAALLLAGALHALAMFGLDAARAASEPDGA